MTALEYILKPHLTSRRVSKIHTALRKLLMDIIYEKVEKNGGEITLYNEKEAERKGIVDFDKLPTISFYDTEDNNKLLTYKLVGAYIKNQRVFFEVFSWEEGDYNREVSDIDTDTMFELLKIINK